MNLRRNSVQSDVLELNSEDVTMLKAGDTINANGLVIMFSEKPSPTVEINIVTAQFAYEHLKRVIRSGPVLDEFKAAITKAESKNNSDPFPVNFNRDMKGYYPELSKTATAENVSANSIQDQVNELRRMMYDIDEKQKEENFKFKESIKDDIHHLDMFVVNETHKIKYELEKYQKKQTTLDNDYSKGVNILTGKPIKVLPLSEFVPIDKKHGTLHVPTIVVISMMKKINEIIDVINK